MLDKDLIKTKTVLVFGDAMLDSYVYGTVSRVSPEAPIPIVQMDKSEYRMGGAANVANNISALGARVQLACLIGNDTESKILEDMLCANGILCDGVLHDSCQFTIQKERIVGNGQQIVRVDHNDYYTVSFDLQEKFINIISKYYSGSTCQ